MSTLLVATDFSAAGNQAVHYACQLAADLQAEVVLLHAYMIPVAFGDTPMPLVPMQDMQQISEEHLDEFWKEIQAQYPGIAIQKQLDYGDIKDCLTDAIQRLHPLLVLIGNQGAGHSDLWLGSTAVSLLRHLQAPVLAIPEAGVYGGIRNICLACDFKDTLAHSPVLPIIELLQRTGARLHVLHIGPELSPESGFESSTRAGIPEGIEIVFHYATAGPVDEGITRFAEARHMDWLAVIPHHHGFWEGLFHKSHTKAMARMSHIPVLSLHAKEKQ